MRILILTGPIACGKSMMRRKVTDIIKNERPETEIHVIQEAYDGRGASNRCYRLREVVDSILRVNYNDSKLQEAGLRNNTAVIIEGRFVEQDRLLGLVTATYTVTKRMPNVTRWILPANEWMQAIVAARTPETNKKYIQGQLIQSNKEPTLNGFVEYHTRITEEEEEYTTSLAQGIAQCLLY